MKPYEFAVIRYRHSASDGECMNVGLAMWMLEEKELIVKINERYERLSHCFAPFDGHGYRRMARHVESAMTRVCSRIAPGGIDDVLRLALPDPESSFQCSEIMGGIAADPHARFAQLFFRFVERHEARHAKPTRKDDERFSKEVEVTIEQWEVSSRVRRDVPVTTPLYEYTFKAGWNNGKLQVMEPVSLDYAEGSEVVEKANKWSGRLLTLSRGGSDFGMNLVVALPQREALGDHGRRAIEILAKAPKVRSVTVESEMDNLRQTIERDLASHDSAKSKPKSKLR